MSAILAPCRRYRYRLDRNVHLFGTIVLGFCLHNPSTADEVADDPTVRRCISFAEALDAKRLVIVNAWAGRATDPAELWKLDDPIGPDNDAHIADVADEVAASGGYVIAGWGRPKPPATPDITAAQRFSVVAERLLVVEEIIREARCPIKALGCNNDSSPKHPLYIPSHERPLPWTGLTRERAMARGRPHTLAAPVLPPEILMTTDNPSSRTRSAARAAGGRT